MVKILSSKASKMYRNSEQYSDCSNLLIKDGPPLEELDPAILSCGLPAIILSDIQPVFAPPPIRYTIDQLQAIRNSSLSLRRPLAADDPRVSVFSIWRAANNTIHSNRRGGSSIGSNASNATQQQNEHRNHNSGNNGRDKSPERAGKFRNHHGRENGFGGQRFRRNFGFSSSNHHVIVKSYRSDSDHHHLQNTVIEEEPEWMTAGPTSRLDTIELRGFDDDLSVSQSSSEKIGNGDSKNSSKSSGKHISFFDDLHHYEHVHHARKGNNSGGSGSGILKSNDSSGRENDVESVTTSNTGSPPPARSTPTKHTASEFNNQMTDDGQRNTSGVNVNNFEEFMKFDSLLGSDSTPATNVPSGSRFSKWFRRGGNSFNHSFGNNYDARRQAFHLGPDGLGPANNNRYPADRHYAPQQYGASRFSSYQGPVNQSAEVTAFKHLLERLAQNRTNNNPIAQQQQYLMQMLNKNQQSESLRRMLMKNTMDNVSDGNQHQQSSQQQTPRVPTQLELQLHTQSIMQNALLRKKLQDQRKIIIEQNHQMAEMVAVAAAGGKSKPNAEVQQFVKSVSPNIQRSLSLLSQTTGNDHYRSFNQTFSGSNSGIPMNNPAFGGGSHQQQDLSASLRQMLLPQYQHQQQGSRPFGGNRRRYEKRSVTWKHLN